MENSFVKNMNKRIIWTIVLSSIILGGISGWVIVRFVAPKLNTIPFFAKNNLLPANAPLVINTREQVRVTEGSDSVAAIQRAKPWLVGIVSGKDIVSARVVASGILVTSDGLIATTKNAVGSEKSFVIVFSDGNTSQAAVAAVDPASDLVLLKAEGQNLPTSPFGITDELRLGQRMIMLSASASTYQAQNKIVTLSSETRNQRQGVIYSDVINTSFAIDGTAGLPEGAMALSLDALVQGIYSSTGIITSDTIKSALNSYFANKAIQRNTAGLYYQNISKSYSSAFKLPQGILVRRPDPRTSAVVPGGSAAVAGILENDVITSVNGTEITEDNSFEKLLNQKAPGETLKLKVARAGQVLDVNLVVGKR
jgi:S1-C subfamily serine protease